MVVTLHMRCPFVPGVVEAEETEVAARPSVMPDSTNLRRLRLQAAILPFKGWALLHPAP